jgi:hypothetical protein
VVINRADDLVRIHIGGLHGLGKEIPFNLRQGTQQMIARQQRVLASARFIDGTVNDALSGFSDFHQWNVQIIDLHRSNLLVQRLQSDCRLKAVRARHRL